MSLVTPGAKFKIADDIWSGDILIFRSGEEVMIEADSPDLQRPDYRYVVQSTVAAKKFRLRERDFYLPPVSTHTIPPIAKPRQRLHLRRGTLVLATTFAVLVVAVTVCLMFSLVVFQKQPLEGTPLPKSAAGEKSWNFEKFNTDIKVNADGSLTVRETEVANFIGSFTFMNRDLVSSKASFTDGRTYGDVQYLDIRVYDRQGKPYDNWRIEQLPNGRRVHISFSATDRQIGWIIEYRMTGAIIYAQNYDRVYFNTVSYHRDVTIKNSRSTVTLPKGSDMSSVKATSYPDKGTPPDSSFSGVEDETLWWDTKTIAPYTNFTIDVAFPKGVVRVPST